MDKPLLKNTSKVINLKNAVKRSVKVNGLKSRKFLYLIAREYTKILKKININSFYS